MTVKFDEFHNQFVNELAFILGSVTFIYRDEPRQFDGYTVGHESPCFDAFACQVWRRKPLHEDQHRKDHFGRIKRVERLTIYFMGQRP